MGATLGCCSSHANTLSSRELRERLGGDCRRMKFQPEVWVTIAQVVFKDYNEISFSPSTFSLEGLELHAIFEITGTNHEIMKEIGAEAAIKLMDKARVAPSKGSGDFTCTMGKPKPVVSPASLMSLNVKKQDSGPDRIKDKFTLGKGSWDSTETKVFDLHSTLSMIREPGHNEVRVQVKQLEAAVAAADGSAMRVPLQGIELRKYIEDACSEKAWEVIREQIR